MTAAGINAGSIFHSDTTQDAGNSVRDASMSLSYHVLHAFTFYTCCSALFWLLNRTTKNPNPLLCPHCSYDLRATPDAAGPLLPQCPECGKPAELTTA